MAVSQLSPTVFTRPRTRPWQAKQNFYFFPTHTLKPGDLRIVFQITHSSDT
jgi:hypothetical protein